MYDLLVSLHGYCKNLNEKYFSVETEMEKWLFVSVE